jgi:hypothetical protein
MPPEMREQIDVRALVPFGLGGRVVEVGEVLRVSRSRGSYLVFLRLVEFV